MKLGGIARKSNLANNSDPSHMSMPMLRVTLIATVRVGILDVTALISLAERGVNVISVDSAKYCMQCKIAQPVTANIQVGGYFTK